MSPKIVPLITDQIPADLPSLQIKDHGDNF